MGGSYAHFRCPFFPHWYNKFFHMLFVMVRDTIDMDVCRNLAADSPKNFQREIQKIGNSLLSLNVSGGDISKVGMLVKKIPLCFNWTL